MSYLNNTRLIFDGTFQADVSTVNNDVRHFDNANFEERFQEFQTPDGTGNGWWNPVGSGAFRLLGCKITSAHYSDGSNTTDPSEDPALGLFLAGANDRVAAKLVDLDPQWQGASQIWGLKVRLASQTNPALVEGSFRPAAFRDLTFARVHTGNTDGDASSTFQSTIEEVVWAEEAATSRVLRELRALSPSLSMRLMTFGYVGRYGDPRFSMGRVCGVIGPALPNEPRTFVQGRRFLPASRASSGQPMSWNGFNGFTGVIEGATPTLFLDLSNAIQLSDRSGIVRDIGRLTVGVLKDPTVKEHDAVTASNFAPFGEINYRAAGWLFSTSGVASLTLTAEQLVAVRQAPLALAAEQPMGSSFVAIRETVDGLFVRAEEFVQRLDAPASVDITLHASAFGEPLAGAKVTFTLEPPALGVTGGGPDGPNPPTAPTPVMGSPTNVLSFPEAMTTDANGRVILHIDARSPGSPRQYIDGQVYLIDYELEGQTGLPEQLLENVVLHVRDAYSVPEKPAWDPDIKPIFTQYGNLYPIMSRRLLPLTDPVAVKSNLKILQLAFSLDIQDPNYMPVTRDMSSGKRLAIQRWLRRLETEDDPTFTTAAPRQAAGPIAPSAMKSEPEGGKTRFVRNLVESRRPK
jgi:hypothetical protein